MSPGEPSPEVLRKAARELDALAEQARTTIEAISGYSIQLEKLPGRIHEVIAATATGIDKQALSQLSAASGSVKNAIGSLYLTADLARSTADAAHQQATTIERQRASESKDKRR